MDFVHFPTHIVEVDLIYCNQAEFRAYLAKYGLALVALVFLDGDLNFKLKEKDDHDVCSIGLL